MKAVDSGGKMLKRVIIFLFCSAMSIGLIACASHEGLQNEVNVNTVLVDDEYVTINLPFEVSSIKKNKLG